jgi:hypothetical protein
MSREDAVVLASRSLALLFTVWALSEVSYLPDRLYSFLQYGRHSYLISLGFLVTRVVGFSLLAMWLRKCGPEVEELLFPAMSEGTSLDSELHEKESGNR